MATNRNIIHLLKFTCFACLILGLLRTANGAQSCKELPTTRAVFNICRNGNPEAQSEPAVPEPSVPEPKVPEPSVPEPKVPEPSVPEPEVPEPGTPEPENPQPGAPEPES